MASKHSNPPSSQPTEAVKAAQYSGMVVELSDEPRLSSHMDSVIEHLERSPDRAFSIVLDLTRVNFLTTSSMGRLLEIRRRIHASGGSLYLYNIGKEVRDLLAITGLEKIFRYTKIIPSDFFVWLTPASVSVELKRFEETASNRALQSAQVSTHYGSKSRSRESVPIGQGEHNESDLRVRLDRLERKVDALNVNIADGVISNALDAMLRLSPERQVALANCLRAIAEHGPADEDMRRFFSESIRSILSQPDLSAVAEEMGA
jgi:anti-anti-sigma factor